MLKQSSHLRRRQKAKTFQAKRTATLAERERLYRTAFDYAGVGIVISTPVGRLFKVNSAFAEMLDLPIARIERLSVDDITDPLDLEISHEIRAELLQGSRDTAHFEKRYLHESGQSVWADITTHLLRDSLRRPTFFVTCVQDITTRKRAELAAREAEERLHFALDRSKIGGWTVDFDTRKATSTLEHSKIFGYSEVQTDWSFDRFMTHVLEEDREFVRSKIQEGAATDQDWDFECRVRRLDGSIRWLRVTGTKYAVGLVKGNQATGIMQDITERKQIVEENVSLEAKLRQSQRLESVGRFASGVAHDFNNMLGVILGSVELASVELGASHPVLADLVEIRKAAKRSADLIARLLAFARQQPIEPRVVDVNSGISGMLKLIQRLVGEDILLKLRPEKPLWQVKIDPSQLDQLMINLCVNARDAIVGVGTVTISTANVVTENRSLNHSHVGTVEEFVRITVTDDGCGMSPEVLSRIFEPFFTTKEVGKGTGLGLAVVYGIVTQNGGFLDVESKIGEGTTFSVHLRRCQVESEVSETEQTVAIEQRGSETILLVEDEPAMRTTTERLLKNLGYCVLSARGPKQALAYARQFSGRIDLILTDVVMPEMNGKELSECIRELQPTTKHLFMSGHIGNVELGSEVLLLRKPFSMKTLGDKVREALLK
jgi:PAS domain S-box-containing protein